MKENALSLNLISGKINLDGLTDEQRQQAYNELRPYAKPAELIKEKEEALRKAATKIADSAPQRVNAAIQQLIRGDGLYQTYFCNVVNIPEVLHAAFVERGENLFRSRIATICQLFPLMVRLLCGRKQATK